MTKFVKYDHVQIVKDLGDDMSHFISDIDAIVIESDFIHSDVNVYTNVYSLYVNGYGEAAWYDEDQLTLIDKNGKTILKEWKDKETLEEINE